MSATPHEPYLPFRGVDNDAAFYSPLDADPHIHPIRYVTLHPGTPCSPIICSLGHEMLDRSAETIISYEALSYCWGSIEDTVDIILHGQHQTISDNFTEEMGDAPFSGRFRVTRNLEEALRALRYEDAPRFLWIDAIWINQMDPVEKTSQVRQMNRIYENAENVLVWLGAADEDSALVLKGAEILEQETKRCQKNHDRKRREGFKE